MTFSRIVRAGAFSAGVLLWSSAGWAQAIDDMDRMSRMENTIRTLTGQVEELNYQLSVLQEQVRRLQEDTNYRLQALEGGTVAPAAQQGAAPALAAPTQDPGTAAATAPAVGVPVAQLGTPPQDLGQVTIDGTPGSQPLDLSTLAGAATVGADPAMADQQQVASIAPTGDPRADYDQAYSLIRSGRYDMAEQSFRQFLSAYPSDELAPEAQYWLGESFFARGDYARAAEEFRAGYKAYPKSRRGPDTLLKLGLSMAGLGYRDEACQMYAATLKQYPDMSNALLQRVRNEQASASC